MSDNNLIFEQYIRQKRVEKNLLNDDTKYCLECGTFIPLEEYNMLLKESFDEEDADVEEEIKHFKSGRPNGYVLYEGKNVHGNFVCVATGLVNKSANIKTGPMVQIFIISSDMSPMEAIRTGANAVACWGCKHKPATAEQRAQGIKGGACYVDASKSVTAVYKGYKKGCYPNICGDNPPDRGNDAEYLERARDQISSVFSGRTVRFGAYGEPVNLPFGMVKMIAGVAAAHTGYTHRWQSGGMQAYKEFFMASVDSEQEYEEAKKKGWRTFRVMTEWKLAPREIVCLNSWLDKTCFECTQCNGAGGGNGRDIAIKVHGKSKARFNEHSSPDQASSVVTGFGTESDVTDKYSPEDDTNPEMTKSKMSVSGHSRQQEMQIGKADEIEAIEQEAKAKRKSESLGRRREENRLERERIRSSFTRNMDRETGTRRQLLPKKKLKGLADEELASELEKRRRKKDILKKLKEPSRFVPDDSFEF
jgi:hypothetical protein